MSTAEVLQLRPNPCPGPPFPPTSRSSYHCRHDAQLRPKWGFGCWEYWTLFEVQHGRCAICGQVWRLGGGVHRLAIDHCHRTGFVRGLAHASCQGPITTGWVDLIERRPGDGPIPLSGGDWISREIVRYVRNPPGWALHLVVPPDKLARIEEIAERNAARQAERERSGRGRTARSGEPSHLRRLLRGDCDCAECERRARLLPVMRERAETARQQRAAEAQSRREVWTLARRIAEATWDRQQPRVVRLLEPREQRAQRRRVWVEERLRPLHEELLRQLGWPVGKVAMPQYPRWPT